MEKISAIATILENNRSRILEARRILDSAAALSLLGASSDQQARTMIVSGSLAATASAGVLAGVALTGIAGPVLLGMALIPTAAKLSMCAGFAVMAGGFVRGFRKGIEYTEQSKVAMEKIAALLAEHGQSIKDINTTVLFGTQPQLAGE